MDSNIQKLQALIAGSPLKEDERNDILALFAKARDTDLMPLVELCTKNPDWIRRCYENIKSKQAAIAADDADAWERIIREEEQMLHEMTE